MNYVGSISILDRGDAPAQAIIDRNARSLAQRMADETRDELSKVMSRVHTIYGAMDTAEDLYPTTASMEYLNDLAELEAILKDEIKKRQYQQQVTVFIVGYQDVCHQKLVLLQQVNEFFMENSKRIDEEDWFPTTPDIDLDEMSSTVEESLSHAHELTNRLSDLNKEMVDYMANLAERKASNKGRKKIEKALQQAKDEVSGLSEKLLALQTELDDREEKVQTMFKQLESKNMEVQKFRTAAELAKKAAEDMETLAKEVTVRDVKILAQRQELSRLQVELTQSNHMKERTETKLTVSDVESQQKIILLQKELEEQKSSNEETKADLTRLLDNQINALHESHRQEMEELKKQHQTEAKQLKEEVEESRQLLARSQHELIQLQIDKGVHSDTPSEVGRVLDLDSEASQQASRQSSKQESRPSTKDTKVSSKSLTSGGKQGKTGARSPTRSYKAGDSKPGSRTSGPRSAESRTIEEFFSDSDEDYGDGKEFAEVAIQDEGGDPVTATVDEKVRTPATRQSRRSKSTLAPVLESDFDSAFDLMDEPSWAAVPSDQLTGRFAQYRRLSTHRLQELEEQLQLNTARTKRKVSTLKAQFQEHKSKWEAERKVLIEQVDQSLRLQSDAEKEADAAMTQLEDFISEQERLEQEEDVKRSEVLQVSASLTPLDALSPTQGSSAHTPTAGSPHPPHTIPPSPESEQELQRLMQQTDDAKVQEMNARLGSCVSAPPAVDMGALPQTRPPQEADQEVEPEDVRQEAGVDLAQLKELPLLDIVDTAPSGDVKPPSALYLPSEATAGSSSMKGRLDSSLGDFVDQDNDDDDSIKLLKEKANAVGGGVGVGVGGGELMDDASNLEKARSQISEREATQGGGGAESVGGGVEYEGGGGGGDGSSVQGSRQVTDTSLGPVAHKSFVGKSLSSLDGMKIEGATEEEIRTSSALSRASLRETYKAKLEEAKVAAEDRRSRSPAIQLTTQMTVDDELVLEDDDDDDDDYDEEEGYDLPGEFVDHKDPSMYEMGTSPPPGFLKGSSRDPSKLSHTGGGRSRDPSDFGRGGATVPSRDPSQPVIQKIVRKGTSVLEHPLLKEYLKAYDGVVNFKDGMGKMFLDKDMMSAHQMTSDLETPTFDPDHKVMPQVEELTKSVLYVLDELSTLVNSLLVYDREPPVSSLHFLSREPTQKSFSTPAQEALAEHPTGPPQAPPLQGQAPPPAPPVTRDGAESEHSGPPSQRSGRASNSSDKIHIRELRDQYNQLKQQLEDDGKTHQDQLSRNTVVMMEMQDTINDLQRELSALGKSAKRTKSSLSSGRGTAIHHKSPSPETSVMFTRLDSERNAKIMKKAVMEEKLDSEKYKEAVSKMDQYVSLPAQRLAHLVRKYVHHSRMREVEEKVKNSSCLNDEAFQVLDKMEVLQNQRARQWADRMDEMGVERLKLANLLMDTLDGIEQESGIFLIKPMYSYRGRDVKPGPPGKLSRPVRQQQQHQHQQQQQQRNATPSNDAQSSFIPAPTPASNYRLVRHERYFLQQQQQQMPATLAEMRPVETRQSLDEAMEVKVAGSGMTLAPGTPRSTWSMQASQPWAGKEDPSNPYNTPRILELDINRMLIGQNNISTKVPFPPSDDRLTNANQNTLRSYVTVNRPTAPLGTDKQDLRPSSGRDSAKSTNKKVRVSDIDKEIPAALPIPSPLPPITPTYEEEEEEVDDEEEEEKEGSGGEEADRPPSVVFSDDDEEGREEPPTSPPGSSTYQSVTKHDDVEEKTDNQLSL